MYVSLLVECGGRKVKEKRGSGLEGGEEESKNVREMGEKRRETSEGGKLPWR